MPPALRLGQQRDRRQLRRAGQGSCQGGTARGTEPVARVGLEAGARRDVTLSAGADRVRAPGLAAKDRGGAATTVWSSTSSLCVSAGVCCF